MQNTSLDMELVDYAKDALKKSYCPYSNFKVAAAVRGYDGTIYTGVNVENSSYGLSMCAERVAIFKAVSEGCFEIESVLLYTDSEEPVFPCGACLQVINEFEANTVITLLCRNGYKQYALAELLPYAFQMIDEEE